MTGRHLREGLLVVAVLTTLAVLVFGRHVADGGLYSDDWSSLDGFLNLPDPGYRTSVDSQLTAIPDKPILAFLLPLLPAAFGSDAAPQIAVGLALGVATTAMFHVVLRRLGMAMWPALASAAAALVYPWADAIRFWPTASVNCVALILFFAGLLVALHGLRARGRARPALHAAALVLYAASVLTYQAAAGWIIVALVAYWIDAGRSAALRRWPADLAVAVATLAYTRVETAKTVPSLGAQVRHLPEFAMDAGRLLARSILPVGAPRLSAAALVALAIIAAAVIIRHARTDQLVRRWAWVLGLGALATAAAWLPFVPSAYYTAMRPGLENRVNISAAYGVVLVVGSLWMLTLLGVRLLVRDASRRLLQVMAVGVALLVIAGYAALTVGDAEDWAESARIQDRTLAAVAAMPHPPPGSTVYVVGEPAVTAPRVSIFADVWELNSAARVQWRDRTLRAYPVFTGARLTCAPDGVAPQVLPGPHGALRDERVDPAAPYDEPYWRRDHGAPYGRVVLLSVDDRESVVVDSQEACRRDMPSFVARAAPFRE
jgi:hypothetical protein